MASKLVAVCILIMVIAAECKPQPPPLDGLGEVSITNPEIVKLAKKSFAKFNAQHKGAYTFKRIKWAGSQQTAGTIYDIKYIVAKGKSEECIEDGIYVEPFNNKEDHDIKKCT
ncbi:unnamed protein product [Bursaphelenchus xylophilus]|uniref:(pine wood nematode) hypothetical protein n=1 Tax=Bursaphelenchus xylophilus TaxID=6326 RepID=A0A1I7SCS8_BURXY|nr:unnamed protein product [Bursaphelenchus xylophilus]CAG9093569.1 unnamed protein product [Bursaphelenchus xylophilus]